MSFKLPCLVGLPFTHASHSLSHHRRPTTIILSFSFYFSSYRLIVIILQSLSSRKTISDLATNSFARPYRASSVKQTAIDLWITVRLPLFCRIKKMHTENGTVKKKSPPTLGYLQLLAATLDRSEYRILLQYANFT